MTINLYSIEIEPIKLADELAQVVGQAQELIMEIEWWNQPAVMNTYANLESTLQNDPTGTLRGCVFGKQFEIRWRKLGASIRMILIADEMPAMARISSGWQKIEPANIHLPAQPLTRARSLYLWGSQYHGDNLWSELRLGRDWNYPVEPRGNNSIDAVVVDTIEYLDSSNHIALTRRTGLRAWKKA